MEPQAMICSPQAEPQPAPRFKGRRLLLVEDDQDAVRQLTFRLTRMGFSVDTAENAEQGQQLATRPDYDAIILDLILPDGNGEEICARLRAAGIDTPVLMLSGRDRVADKVSGFRRGADDYVTKPFAFEELFERLAALMRRRPPKDSPGHVLVAGDIILDREVRSVQYGGRVIDLSPREADLLAYLIERRGRIVPREEVLAHVWAREGEASTNTVDVYIRYLRQKIWGGRESSPIHTVRGVGYILRA